MLELAEGIIIAAIAATFFSDIMSRLVKMIRARRHSRIQVAHAEHSV